MSTLDQESTPPTTKHRPEMRTRGYQEELLEYSRRHNVVIALPTGSGKTRIAVLRLKDEIDRGSTKVSWFLAPTRALVDQQYKVIKKALPDVVGYIHGASVPEKWTKKSIWTDLLRIHKIIVSTPQILFDALSNGYINLGQDIGLVVFDEAHKALGEAPPYKMIMQSFYHTIPTSNEGGSTRPVVLGLTASPLSLAELEKIFDGVVRSTIHNQEELSQVVRPPTFKILKYPSPTDVPSSRNLEALRAVISVMNIEDDPAVASLRTQLANLPADAQRSHDQRLSKIISKEHTVSHKGLRDFMRSATQIHDDLGPWAADWFIVTVIQHATEALSARSVTSYKDEETSYLLKHLRRIDTVPYAEEPEEIMAGLSLKVHSLLKCLEEEESVCRTSDDQFRGLIFVKRREVVVVLGEILRRIPTMMGYFQIGCQVGSSSSTQRYAPLDITRALLKQDDTTALKEFKSGKINLMISTAVVEEGIDVQACGCVIRFDPPENMTSWLQSRGRARKSDSTFILMLDEESADDAKWMRWEDDEFKMTAQITDEGRAHEESLFLRDEDSSQYRVSTTGALLIPSIAVSRLYHFCGMLPHSSHGDNCLLFELDPPDFTPGWHGLDPKPSTEPYDGPWGAVCTLPKQVPPHLCRHIVPCEHPSKRAAINCAAYVAYLKLYEAGLVNDHLLPIKVPLKDIEKRAGTANVSIQMDPWAVPQDGTISWRRNVVVIEGLPALYMFTPTELPSLTDDELPTLYVPERGAVTVSLSPSSAIIDDANVIEAARVYTHRTLGLLHRMEPEKTDFCYLFLPTVKDEQEEIWETRRQWMQERVVRSETLKLESEGRANAELLCKQFGYSLDLALLRSNGEFDKPLRFVKFCDEPISDGEAEKLKERYHMYPDFKITYPLVVARPCHVRANFLVPLEEEPKPQSDKPDLLLHPKYTTVELVSTHDSEISLLLPSLIRFLSIAVTVHSMRETLFASTPLYHIPFPLLRTALTAPVSQEPTHYQRLETLGDTVLKYVTSMQLYSQYPLWHEGCLSRRKDHTVNNDRLAKEAIRLGLERWIIRDRFVPRKWRPRYISDSINAADLEDDAEPMAGLRDHNGGSDGSEEPAALRSLRDKTAKTQSLSTKMVADVVEAVIGAAYEHGGIDLAVDCIRIFDLQLPKWSPISSCVETALSHLEHMDELPSQLSTVENILGYTFSKKSLLVEALTHPSYTGNTQTTSYERLEFLGDAVLDMVVTDYVYNAEGKNLPPGVMHMYKEALVNSHLLGYTCIDASMPHWSPHEGLTSVDDSQRVHLFRCMLHTGVPISDNQDLAFDRYKERHARIKEVLDTLAEGGLYPWAALTSLQAPKFLSDMLESCLGGVFLDSGGNLDVVRQVLETLGIMSIMRRIVAGNVDTQHPVSRLTTWAATPRNERKCEIMIDKADGPNVTAVVKIDGEEVSRATQILKGQMSVDEVRITAAEDAIRKLRIPVPTVGAKPKS